jgi:hypothetical protein
MRATGIKDRHIGLEPPGPAKQLQAVGKFSKMKSGASRPWPGFRQVLDNEIAVFEIILAVVIADKMQFGPDVLGVLLDLTGKSNRDFGRVMYP